MADLRTREAARRYATDGGLRDGLTSGLLVPGYTSVREVPCGCRGGMKQVRTPTMIMSIIGESCERCDGTGSMIFNPWDLVRLRAYLGDEEARGLVDHWTDCNGWSMDWGDGMACYPDAYRIVAETTWLDGLKHLASKLPPYRVEVECADVHCTKGLWLGTNGAPDFHCETCNGTGKVTHDTRAERYLLVVAAHGVAREVEKTLPGPKSHRDYGVWLDRERVREALDACAQWLKCPCPTCQDAWIRADAGPDWLPRSRVVTRSQAPAIQAAAKILGSDTRDHAARSVLGAL